VRELPARRPLLEVQTIRRLSGHLHEQAALPVSPLDVVPAHGGAMDPRVVILLAICLLSGCSALSGPDVERAFRECLIHGGSPTFIVSADTKRAECKR
jgi:hypothetical protein